ncbi:hypothetical protein MNBD_GAMMA06-1820 [hydrothermal vent metagenome]|uniref:VWFA domain-containing protein n=1 Tax=hydrothermal vent metagenome TaxID=652676 RepID=A0A3B0WFK9_9ZZZZ
MMFFFSQGKLSDTKMSSTERRHPSHYLSYHLPHRMFFAFRINRLLLVASVLLSHLLLSACSSQHIAETERKLVYRSLSDRPAWITSLPNDPNYFFTVGISTSTSSLRQGRLTAARDAAIEVSNYLGLRTSARFEVETNELTTRIVNEMTTTTSARFERTSLSQMYYEEFHHAGSEESENIFDVYVLLRMPMAELLQEQKKRKQERDAVAAEVEIIKQEAQQHFQDGHFPLAWQKWMLAMQLLDKESVGSVSSLQIYKTLLTVVEGINLSIAAGDVGTDVDDTGNKQENKIAATVVVRANYAGSGNNIPLKNLPLHFRLAKDKQAGKVKKTNVNGQLKYFFPTSNKHASDKRAINKNGLEIRMEMSPYVINKKGLSSELMQKVGFLEERLERKVAQYGEVTFTKPRIVKSPFQAVVMTGKEGGLVEVNVASNNAYILSGGDFFTDNKKTSLTMKVDIMPVQSKNMKRTPLNLSVVLDKSSSMNEDDKFAYTKKATEFLIDNLTPQDYLSVVTYDSDIEIIIPAAPVSFKKFMKHHLAKVEPDGMTNLSGGLFEGYTQVKKNINSNRINRILLLSDGKANQGITDNEQLISYTKKYAEEGIAVSAIGVGKRFNEELMMAIAETSNGNYYYIKNPENIPEIFIQELSGLLNVAAQNARINLTLKEGVYIKDSFGHPYTKISQNKYQFRLGDISYGDRGIILIELDVPLGGEGEKDLAVVEVSYDAAGGPSTQKSGRQKSTKQISAVYTESANLVAASKNMEVEKYVLLTRSIEQLEVILQSMDEKLYDKAIKNLRETYASLENFARTSEDPGFLQRMKFLKHFEHEIEELKESNALHGHDESLTKELGYQLYLQKHSHRSLDHPLHPTGR